jgi:hypothetical protein
MATGVHHRKCLPMACEAGDLDTTNTILNVLGDQMTANDAAREAGRLGGMYGVLLGCGPPCCFLQEEKCVGFIK